MIKPLADETLVYDLTAHRATCLNGLAASVWQNCDGTRDITALARAVGAADLAVVQQAVQKLADAGLLVDTALLTETVTLADTDKRTDRSARYVDQTVDAGRRAAMQKLVAGAAIAAPIVTTMTVPTAAQAASCGNAGEACVPGSCCPGNGCVGGFCAPFG